MRGTKRLKLGIIANELFNIDLGRMGGFGWAVQQVSRCFADDPTLGVDVVILMGEKQTDGAALPRELHGCKVYWQAGRFLHSVKQLRSERIDLLLCIDYRPSYRFFFYALPRVPVVIWVRDPWDRSDRTQVATLRIPGQGALKPRGTKRLNTSSLGQIARLFHLVRRRLLFATTAQFLAEKVAEAYGIEPGVVYPLPNIINPISGPVAKSNRPTIVSLARLDPTKRPWIFAALARRFPDVDFIFAGQSYVRGPGSWEATGLPQNTFLLGHVGEIEKRRLLSQAWLLVNTSIHEGLAVSFLEALACETPLIACVNPEGLVSRFGMFVGTYPSTGMEALPALELAVVELLNDADRRQRLGADGRAWVSSAHNKGTFLKALSHLCILAGIDKHASSRLIA